jgi:hypothetical protein
LGKLLKMKPKFLLPHRYKAIGWIITVPAFILMMLYLHADYKLSFLDYKPGLAGQVDINIEKNFLFTLHAHNFTADIGGILVITGLLMIAFSKEKMEDERINTLRLESLLWAVYVNSILLILAIIFLYGEAFLQVMTYNICTPLILFIARFNYVMYQDRKYLNPEIQ